MNRFPSSDLVQARIQEQQESTIANGQGNTSSAQPLDSEERYYKSSTVCHVCGRELQTRKKLMQHMELEHKETESDEEPEIKVICLERQHQQKFLDHLQGVSIDPSNLHTISSPVIDSLLKTIEEEAKEGSNSGVKISRLPEKLYRCFWCSSSFRKRGKLMDHIDSLHKASKQQIEEEAEMIHEGECKSNQFEPMQTGSSLTHLAGVQNKWSNPDKRPNIPRGKPSTIRRSPTADLPAGIVGVPTGHLPSFQQGSSLSAGHMPSFQQSSSPCSGHMPSFQQGSSPSAGHMPSFQQSSSPSAGLMSSFLQTPNSPTGHLFSAMNSYFTSTPKGDLRPRYRGTAPKKGVESVCCFMLGGTVTGKPKVTTTTEPTQNSTCKFYKGKVNNIVLQRHRDKECFINPVQQGSATALCKDQGSLYQGSLYQGVPFPSFNNTMHIPFYIPNASPRTSGFYSPRMPFQRIAGPWMGRNLSASEYVSAARPTSGFLEHFGNHSKTSCSLDRPLDLSVDTHQRMNL